MLRSGYAFDTLAPEYWGPWTARCLESATKPRLPRPSLPDQEALLTEVRVLLPQVSSSAGSTTSTSRPLRIVESCRLPPTKIAHPAIHPSSQRILTRGIGVAQRLQPVPERPLLCRLQPAYQLMLPAPVAP